MTDNVIELRPEGYDGLICDCGSAWWRADICLTRDLHVSGHSGLRCRECDSPYLRGEL